MNSFIIFGIGAMIVGLLIAAVMTSLRSRARYFHERMPPLYTVWLGWAIAAAGSTITAYGAWLLRGS